ncbi:MAG: hypothetical protein O9274_03775 [Limnobacter sp.]|uniref:hypothetical protein n=1 Tax=Limnobacter sp. TaxID=2003368 RepID=UPI0022C41F33|nr:hypothetical protein [Limnobacter sp.]MCZ8014795.1 hypothetical protein [Limnobacter sp.]
MKVALILSALFLSACGGGGGGSDVPVAPSASTSAFALDTASTNFYTVPRTFNLNAVVNGTAFNVILSYSPQPDVIFEGVLSKVNQATSTVRENNVVQFSDTVLRFFTTGPLLFRGATSMGDPDGQNYLVSTFSDRLPATANVGSTGPVATALYFTDVGKTNPRGSEVLTYSLEADTANTAFLCTNSTIRNQLNLILLTQSECIKINPAGDELGLKVLLGEYTNGSFVRTIEFQE